MLEDDERIAVPLQVIEAHVNVKKKEAVQAKSIAVVFVDRAFE